MKKLLSLLLAVAMMLLGIGTTTNDVTCTYDRTTATKVAEWENAYYGRCRRVANVTNHTNRERRYPRFMRILSLPALLLLGVACGAVYSGANRIMFRVSYQKDGAIRSKDYGDVTEAYEDFNKIKRLDRVPVKLVSVSASAEVLLDAYKWGTKEETQKAKEEWRENAAGRMKTAHISADKVEVILHMSVDRLKNSVICRDYDALMEMKGIGEKTARKVVEALKPICDIVAIRSETRKTFTRVVLQNDLESDELYIVDEISKAVSPVEAKAIQLGGNDALIHVTSWIADDNSNDLGRMLRVEKLGDIWHEWVRRGLVIDDKKYVPLGHGTNAAKECKTLWVRSDIAKEMRKYIKKGVRKSWRTTVAKWLAYMVGLQSVPRKTLTIPFVPEDCAIMPSVKDVVKRNVTKEFLDGHEEDIDNADVEINRSDGFLMIEIPAEMIPVFYQRMLDRGDDPIEAQHTLAAYMATLNTCSYRSDGAAIKGCGYKGFMLHKCLRDNHVTKTPDGRDVNKISIFMDETVLKTTIGPNGAYEKFSDWADAVRDEFALGTVVNGHKLAKKDISYQVLQCLCEASDRHVQGFAKKTVNRINRLHTVDGVSRVLGRELGHVLRILPGLGSVRAINDRLIKAIKETRDTAFAGKILRSAYYAFCIPDPVYILQGWFGLKRTGCLEEGEINHAPVRRGKLAIWRSPVVHPNSIRPVNNVDINQKYRKYFKNLGENVIICNCKDDLAVALDADWDGDHMSDSDDADVIAAAEETVAVWNRLIIWETPEAKKDEVDEGKILDYMENLTKRNELGLTVFGLNALLNRLRWFKNKETNEKYLAPVPLSRRGVNFKKFASNVLVDASKHGGGTIKEPKESSDSKYMEQPWVKQYRDAVDRGATEEELQEIVAKACPEFMVGTANKFFGYLAKNARRDFIIDNVPKEFEYQKLMFNSQTGYRGLGGIFRVGQKKNAVLIDGKWIRPDEGLFNSIARRFDRDRAEWNREEHKDTEGNEFEMYWRAQALCELEQFALTCGKTLQDAYDVITWQMFAFCDSYFENMDENIDFSWMRDQLWRAYFVVFGGIMEEAAERWEIVPEEYTD